MKNNEIDLKKLGAVATRLRAIAHPMRISIIRLLEENEELNVTQIHTRLKIEQAVASLHLIILKRYGVLQSKRNGKQILYSVKDGALDKLGKCIDICSE